MSKLKRLNPDDKKVGDIAVRADLFHVVTKTAKEQVGPFVYRYRNTELFTKVASQEAKTPGELALPGRGNGPLRCRDKCAWTKHTAGQR